MNESQLFEQIYREAFFEKIYERAKLQEYIVNQNNMRSNYFKYKIINGPDVLKNQELYLEKAEEKLFQLHKDGKSAQYPKAKIVKYNPDTGTIFKTEKGNDPEEVASINRKYRALANPEEPGILKKLFGK